jgi:hypothetical protein
VQPREALGAAVRQIGEMTGLTVESVSAFDRDGDDVWRVTLEVLEVQRVPNTMDVLASYEVRLSNDGELLGFDRRRRYHRAAADDGRS